jgi:DNA polymerase/3'-5' exonuclease PolX
MNLPSAQRTAENIVTQLAPFCEKIEIAGSVRRERNVVNDIDLVILPKPGAIPKIKERCERNMQIFAGRRPDPNNVTFVNDKTGLQLDLFFAHGEIVDLVSRVPTNWGAVYLCRTGSKEHNQQLCIHAHTRGLKFAPYRGVVKKVKRFERQAFFWTAISVRKSLPAKPRKKFTKRSA